jgi:hypothetical protein
MPVEARIALILLKYALLGVVPLVVPSVLLFVPLPIDQIPSQKGTDLNYIQYLAEQAGYVFISIRDQRRASARHIGGRK